MPIYEYYCDDNQRNIRVFHPADVELSTWGELCYVAQVPLEKTDPGAPVRKLLNAPYLHFPVSNSELKAHGFTKLVRRESGCYENVTATDDEHRYFRTGDAKSVPHLHKKIQD